MSKEQAIELAKWDLAYVARQFRDGTWGVWDSRADHVVEFDIRENQEVAA